MILCDIHIIGLYIKKCIVLLVIEILVYITLLKFLLRFLLEILLGFLLGDLLNIRDIMRHCVNDHFSGLLDGLKVFQLFSQYPLASRPNVWYNMRRLAGQGFRETPNKDKDKQGLEDNEQRTENR